MYFTQTKVGSTTGDIWITRATKTGTKTGSMAVHGFGHGQGFTVEPTSNGVMIWSEYDHGTRIGRYPFQNGAVLEIGDPIVQDRTPQLSGLTHPYPFYDSLYDRMWYWFLRDNMPRVVGYSMTNARAGNQGSSTRIAEVHMPPISGNPAFQGFAVCGGWAYLLEGNPPPPGANDPEDNLPAYLTSWNIDRAATSSYGDPYDPAYGHKRFRTRAGDFLKHKEPEGMGLQIVDGQPRLGFGFTSVNDEYATPVTRQATVYYKSDFQIFSDGTLSC